MDFLTMVSAVKKGKRAQRPHWGKDEVVASDGNKLIHNTPYTPTDNPCDIGFYYVVELGDIDAGDWIIFD